MAKGWKGDDMTGWVGNRREPSGEGPGRNGGKETRNPPFIRHASLISFPSSRLGPGVARAGRNGVRDEPNVMKKRAGIDHSRRHTGPFTSVSAHPRLPLLTPFLRHSRSLRSPRMIETFMNDPFREVKVESSQGEGNGNGMRETRGWRKVDRHRAAEAYGGLYRLASVISAISSHRLSLVSFAHFVVPFTSTS